MLCFFSVCFRLFTTGLFCELLKVPVIAYITCLLSMYVSHYPVFCFLVCRDRIRCRLLEFRNSTIACRGRWSISRPNRQQVVVVGSKPAAGSRMVAMVCSSVLSHDSRRERNDVNYSVGKGNRPSRREIGGCRNPRLTFAEGMRSATR